MTRFIRPLIVAISAGGDGFGGTLLAMVMVYGGWFIWASVWGPRTGPVTLIIHSEIDRPILGFSVNGVAGPNAFAHGSGKATCCGSISGKTAEVIWTLSTTRAQYDAGLRKETRRVVMPMPEIKWGENDLHVHFFYLEIKFCWAGAIMPGHLMKNVLMFQESLQSRNNSDGYRKYYCCYQSCAAGR